MRGLTSSPGKSKGREAAEEYEERILHSTINGNRIKSHSSRYGTYRINRSGFTSSSTSDAMAYHIQGPTSNNVSSYLDSMPGSSSSSSSSSSTQLSSNPSSSSSLQQAPPRPPRPPGGLLGISNGRGIGYGRSLGSSYDSPLLIHGSFNGHVRSGANLYGGRNQSSGIMPMRASSSSSSSGSGGGVSRPLTSVFPIQKALEIAMKESKLLQAAATRAGSSSSAGGLTTGMTFVREMRKARHARGVLWRDQEQDRTVATIFHGFGLGTATKAAIEPEKQDQGQNVRQGEGDRALQDDHMEQANEEDNDHDDGNTPQSAHEIIQTSPQPSTALVRLHSGLPHNHPLSSTSPYTISLSPLSIAINPNDFSSDYQHSFSSVFGSSSITAASSSSSSSSSFDNNSTTTSSPYETRSAVHAVRELLDSYPAPSPYCVDEKNRSPLHFAAAAGDIELVEFLLERGVRPDCGRDIAGNMPLHLAIISNRFDVVAALLKAGADMTLASPMTHKTPLDLAESRLNYLLARAQSLTLQAQQNKNNQLATRSSIYHQQTQSAQLVQQIRGIVDILRPYVIRQQRLQLNERAKERTKERSWDRAHKFMKQQDGSAAGGLWRVDDSRMDEDDDDDEPKDGDDEDDDDDDDDMDMEDDNMYVPTIWPAERRRRAHGIRRRGATDIDGDVDLDEPLAGSQRNRRRALKRMDANETELALEQLMNGLSLLEANSRKAQPTTSPALHTSGENSSNHLHVGDSASSMPPHAGVGRSDVVASVANMGSTLSSQDIADGNLADSEGEPSSSEQEQDVDDTLPDLLEQMQQVLQAIKLNEEDAR